MIRRLSPALPFGASTPRSGLPAAAFDLPASRIGRTAFDIATEGCHH